MEHTIFIGLGSNQGEKKKNCARAIENILKLDSSRLVAQSSWYHTQPWGLGEQDWFINGVIQIESGLHPYELLSQLKEIELQFGRQDNGRWGPRPIDIDILFYDNLRIKTFDLEIPHPELHQRKFVLIPMAEIAPNFIHPVYHKAIKDILDTVSDRKKVLKIMD